MALESIWHDARYAMRGLRHNPGFAATAIVSLVFGIGSSVAIFTVADNLLLRPLPYRDAKRLVMVWEQRLRQDGNRYNVVAPGNYLDWITQNDVFDAMAAFSYGRPVLTEGGRSEEVREQIVTPELLPMLGVQPLRGRLFTAQDAVQGAEKVEIISHRMWQGWFGGDEGIIGRKVV